MQQNIIKAEDQDVLLSFFEEDGTTQLDISTATQIVAEVMLGNVAVTNGRFAFLLEGETAGYGPLTKVETEGTQFQIKLEVEAEKCASFAAGTYSVVAVATIPDLSRADGDRKITRKFTAVGNIIDRGGSTLIG